MSVKRENNAKNVERALNAIWSARAFVATFHDDVAQSATKELEFAASFIAVAEERIAELEQWNATLRAELGAP